MGRWGLWDTGKILTFFRRRHAINAEIRDVLEILTFSPQLTTKDLKREIAQGSSDTKRAERGGNYSRLILTGPGPEKVCKRRLLPQFLNVSISDG